MPLSSNNNNGTKVVSHEDLKEATDCIVAAYSKKVKEAQDEAASSSSTTTTTHPRVLVAIAGRPGSGKTTVATVVAKSVAERLEGKVGMCMMPMDGYHLYRSELRAMPNANEAFMRRGAEWTFNPVRMRKDLAKIAGLHSNGNGNGGGSRLEDSDGRGFKDVRVPSFDHAVGDPCEGGIVVPASAGVVIVEGNYLLYKGTPEWAAVNAMFDVSIFLSCPRDVCTERLCKRHMAAWKISRDEAMIRARGSDTINGDLVDTTSVNADLTIHSVDASTAKL